MKRIYTTQKRIRTTQLKHMPSDCTKIVVISAAAMLLGTLPAVAAPPTQTASAQTALAKADTPTAQKMAAKAPTGTCSVIMQIDGDLTPEREAVLKALHAEVTRHLAFIHSAAVTLPTRNLSKLAALPFVTHLSYDGTVKKLDAFTDASSGAASARQQYGLTGSGVTVAVLDSGVMTAHPDLYTSDGKTQRTIAWPDCTSSPLSQTSSGPMAFYDQCGHASHVAGIIAGNGASSTGSSCTHTYYGVAPQANLASVRVLDQNGASTVATVLAGLQWIVANKSKYNIRVVNASLGHPVGESYKTDPLCQAVEAAWKAGIVVVCAAGNDGRLNTTQSGTDNEGWGTAYGSIQSPANDPYVITVGATKSMDGNRADDKIATYSSRGPSRLDLVLKPDIVAPGNKVISLDVDFSVLNYAYASTNLIPYSAYSTATGTSNQAGAGMSNSYFVLSGTSMAAPVVSGAVALMLQKDSTLTPDTIKARLMVAADKWTFPTGSFEAESSANTITTSASVYKNTCFSNGADVHNLGYTGTLQFNQIIAPNAGTYMMTVSYVNGDTTARTAFVSVNGGTAQSVSFAPHGTWTTYQIATTQVPVTLVAGTNTIKFANPTGWAPDIDKITLSLSDPLTFGAGYLNIPAALASTLTVTQAALSPALKIDASGNVTIDTSVIGATTVWGSKAVTGVNTVYGSKAVTGVNSVSSSKAVCGSSVWGDKTICGSSSPNVDLSNVAAYGE